MGFEDLQHNFLTGRIEDLVKWARRNSVWPATFGLACCAIEMMSVGAADYDISRLGMEVFRASPRQADLMIVAGRVSQKMAPVLRQVYDQMMEPKWVISMGVCASTGGMFNNYAIVQGVDQIVPGRRLRPGLPPVARDAPARHPHAAREDPHRRDHAPPRELGPRGRAGDGRLGAHHAGRRPGGHAAVSETTTSAPTPATVVLPEVPRLSDRLVDQIAFPSRDTYKRDGCRLPRRRASRPVRTSARVDYLTHPGRTLPEGVGPERFEVVVNLLSLSKRQRVRIRVQVPESDPLLDSLVDVYPGVDAMEREAYDLVGVVFGGHPDMTRILMPEDWEGHPLRKDYGVGRVPVQFKEAPGPR